MQKLKRRMGAVQLVMRLQEYVQSLVLVLVAFAGAVIIGAYFVILAFLYINFSFELLEHEDDHHEQWKRLFQY